MTHLVVGGDSMIGGAVVPRLAAAGTPAIATSRQSGGGAPRRIFLDLADRPESWDLPPDIAAAVICAAIARLPDCAAEPAGSRRVNVTGTIALARRLAAGGTHVLILSSDKVFDGEAPRAAADRPTAPAGVYGRQKAEAEAGILTLAAEGEPVAILRLSKVVAADWALLREWAGSLASGRPIFPVAGMVFAPVPLATVADAIVAIMDDRATGIFQLSGREDIAYPDVARRLAERLGADRRLVRETTVHGARLPADTAPRHTTLDSSRLAAEFGIAVPDPWQVLDPILADLARRAHRDAAEAVAGGRPRPT